MSRAALSLRVFAFYMLGLGVVLVADPNLLLALFGVPQTTEVWIRVVGMLTMIIGFYYLMASGTEMTAFYGWTILARLSVFVFFAAFAALGFAPATLILFGAVDAVGALWTLICLRKDAKTKSGLTV